MTKYVPATLFEREDAGAMNIFPKSWARFPQEKRQTANGPFPGSSEPGNAVEVRGPPRSSRGISPSMKAMVRAAIVGLGRWGQSLVTSVQGRSDDIRFTLAPYPHPFARGGVLPRHGRDADRQLRGILADPNVDAVVLATPHSQHEAQVHGAAAAGKHVFVEKPITLDRRSADGPRQPRRKAGIVLAVGYCRRFHPVGRSRCGSGCATDGSAR